MAFVHQQSCEGVKSELDIFAVPPTQTSIEDGRWVEHQPLTSLDSGGPIEFVIPGTGYAYLDLANTYLLIRNTYAEPSHMVVNSKPEQNLYQVRPALGGPSKWVNRKMMVLDPRIPPDNITSGLDILPEEVAGVSDDSCDVPAPDADGPSVATVCRRSGQQNKGQHSNPLHLPVAPSV